MKFVCPSCKAKYQIADEKVAGRSVRMKCRKCGHMIHIQESAAEAAAESLRAPPRAEAASTPRAAVTPSSHPAVAPRRPAPPAAPRAAAPAPRAAAPAPARAGLPPPRAPAALRVGGGAAAAPAAPAAVAAPLADVEAPPESGRSLSAYDEQDEATRAFEPSALASAFTRSLEAAPEPPASSRLDVPSEEWHVGINGSPVGPLRLGELRAKVAAGAVTVESLVWREGLGDWEPLGNFPELRAIVEEVLLASSPAAVPAPVFSGVAMAPGPSPETGPGVEADIPPPPRRSGAAAWLAVAVALLFGLTIGFVVFKTDPKQPEVQYVTVKERVEVPVAASGSEPTADVLEPAASAAAVRVGKGPAPMRTTGAADTKPEPGSGGSLLAGLGGETRSPSPGAVQGPSGASAGGGQPLTGDQVQTTIARYKTSVQRSCWQPALDTRAKDAPSAARVTVTITVGPSGAVQGVSTSGDPKGYRGLASCIAGRVRGWQFPPSSGTTTVNVPFTFAAQ